MFSRIQDFYTSVWFNTLVTEGKFNFTLIHFLPLAVCSEIRRQQMSNIPTCLICYHQRELWLISLSFSHWVFLEFLRQLWKWINYMTCKSNGFDNIILCNTNVLLLFYLFNLLLFDFCFISSTCLASTGNLGWVKLHVRLWRELTNMLSRLLSIIFDRL